MSTNVPITVIIPTLAGEERAAFLDRAIESVISQDICARPLVVVNGPHARSAWVRHLEARREIQLLRLAEANLPNALEAGRRAVTTPYFSELDDDDVLLPKALTSRLEILVEDSSVDAVISNVLLHSDIDDETSFRCDAHQIQTAPLANLMRANWMVPGSALFKSDSITVGFFDEMPQYLEWTYLGLRLATERKLKFLQSVSAIHNIGLPFSINDSIACSLGRPIAIRRLQALNISNEIKMSLRKKEGALWHAAAGVHLNRGTLKEAWKAHFRSMACSHGWKYLSFSRHLLRLVGTRIGDPQRPAS